MESKKGFLLQNWNIEHFWTVNIHTITFLATNISSHKTFPATRHFQLRRMFQTDTFWCKTYSALIELLQTKEGLNWVQTYKIIHIRSVALFQTFSYKNFQFRTQHSSHHYNWTFNYSTRYSFFKKGIQAHEGLQTQKFKNEKNYVFSTRDHAKLKM